MHLPRPCTQQAAAGKYLPRSCPALLRTLQAGWRVWCCNNGIIGWVLSPRLCAISQSSNEFLYKFLPGRVFYACSTSKQCSQRGSTCFFNVGVL